MDAPPPGDDRLVWRPIGPARHSAPSSDYRLVDAQELDGIDRGKFFVTWARVPAGSLTNSNLHYRDPRGRWKVARVDFDAVRADAEIYVDTLEYLGQHCFISRGLAGIAAPNMRAHRLRVLRLIIEHPLPSGGHPAVQLQPLQDLGYAFVSFRMTDGLFVVVQSNGDVAVYAYDPVDARFKPSRVFGIGGPFPDEVNSGSYGADPLTFDTGEPAFLFRCGDRADLWLAATGERKLALRDADILFAAGADVISNTRAGHVQIHLYNPSDIRWSPSPLPLRREGCSDNVACTTVDSVSGGEARTWWRHYSLDYRTRFTRTPRHVRVTNAGALLVARLHHATLVGAALRECAHHIRRNHPQLAGALAKLPTELARRLAEVLQEE